MILRVSERQVVLPRTGKPANGTSSKAIRNSILICDYQVAWEGFKILWRESNRSILELEKAYLSKGINEPLIGTNSPRNFHYSGLPFGTISPYIIF